MNESIRRAEDARAATVMRIASDPARYRPSPVLEEDKSYMDGPWSAAISVEPTGHILQIVSWPAERAMINWLCGNEVVGFRRYGKRTTELLLCCIGIANYSMGLIILNATTKMRDPFVRKIRQMDESTQSIVAGLPSDCHSDVRSLYLSANKLVSLSNDSVLNSVHTESRLKIIDAMRTIILFYAEDPLPD